MTAELSEDDKQLYELDRARVSSRQQLFSCRAGIANKTKSKRRAELCEQEISPLPDETTAYKAVGRMFLLTPLPQIRADLTTSITAAETDLITLQQQEKYLITEVERAERNLQEVINKEQKTQ